PLVHGGGMAGIDQRARRCDDMDGALAAFVAGNGAAGDGAAHVIDGGQRGGKRAVDGAFDLRVCTREVKGHFVAALDKLEPRPVGPAMVAVIQDEYRVRILVVRDDAKLSAGAL